MKISIENFKSIKQLHDFEVKPITVLSGINSAGKSSFIQLLLLLKQTLEDSSANKILSQSGKYYSIKDIHDVFNNNQIAGKRFHFGLRFNKSEVDSTGFPDIGFDYEIEFYIDFGYLSEQLVVEGFSIKLNAPESEKENVIKISHQSDHNYLVQSDSDMFGKGLIGKDIKSAIDFVAFYPLSYTIDEEKRLFTFDWFKNALNKIFTNIFYVGPIREEPQEHYVISKRHLDVGKSGQFVAQLLKEKSDEPIVFSMAEYSTLGVEYTLQTETLLAAVKHWMCDVFDVADSIHAEKEDDNYRIFLTPKSGHKINIKHVGFGISQLLPIVVQGLIMPKGGMLLIEQPEIHLHPKVQSFLYDFLYSLTLQDKSVVVETHSSHLITRMRRRIAEDETNEMDNNIQLTFIESDVFRTLEIDDYGTILNYYPKDFIEHPTEEMKAIVEAQIRKRKAND